MIRLPDIRRISLSQNPVEINRIIRSRIIPYRIYGSSCWWSTSGIGSRILPYRIYSSPCWWSTSGIWSRILPYRIYGLTLLVVNIRNREPDTSLSNIRPNPNGGPHPEYGARYSSPTLLVVYIRNMKPDTSLSDIRPNPAGGQHPEYGAGYSRAEYTV